MTEPQIDSRYEIDTFEHITGQFFRPHGVADFVILGLAGPAIIITDLLVSQLAAGGVIIAVLLIMSPLNYGRVYAVFGQWVYSQWILLVNRGWLRSHIPLEVYDIVDGDKGSVIAFVHNTKGDTDTVIVDGRGSSLVAKDLAEQYDGTVGLGNATRRIATEAPGYRLGASYVFSRRPTDIDAVTTNYAENMMAYVVFPPRDGEPTPEWSADEVRAHNLNRVAMELLDVVQQDAGAVRMSAAFHIRRDAPIPAKGVEADKLKRLSVLRTATTAVDELTAAGVANAHALDVKEIEQLLREAWDIDGINDYRLGQMKGAEQSETGHWPQRYIRAHHDALEVDGSWHSVLQIRTNPDGKHSLPYVFRSVFMKEVPWLTVAMIGDAVRSNAEYRFLDQIIPAVNELRLQIGIIHQGPRAQKRDQAWRRRQEVADESKFSMRFSVLVCVSATSREDLDDYVAEAKRRLDVRGFSPKIVTGRSRQLPAFLTATTGIRLL